MKTVLSVRDFVILYNLANDKIISMESQAQLIPRYIEKNMEQLRQDPCYQDLLRIRDKLGELNIEVETPRVEVEE